jgi:hypothetical protein
VLNAYAVTLAALLLPAGVHGPDRAVQARFGRLRVRPRTWRCWRSGTLMARFYRLLTFLPLARC